MPTAPSLRELQQAFMAALYDPEREGPIDHIASNGLSPTARLRIYRRSCDAIQCSALRTSYPALLALGGEDWFDQTARGYRRAHPSTSGNLQTFGAHLAEYLETLPAHRAYPYFADVARLEWLRQETILAPPARALAGEVVARSLRRHGAGAQVTLHPSVHVLASDYPVLTIWHFTLEPTPGGLDLDGPGEVVMLWRAGEEVASALLAPASFVYLAALREGAPLGVAQARATAIDANFDMECLESLIAEGLITGVLPSATTAGDST